MLRTSRQYLWYTSALISFCWFITAMYLPIIPFLNAALHTHDFWINVMISAYFIAFCLSQIYWGPIADNYQRHWIVFITLMITLLGTVLCLVSKNIGMFILGRIVQGFGIGALPALSRSIIHERYESKIVLRFMVYLTSIVAVVTSVAPLIGAVFLEKMGWRSIFAFQLLVNVILLLVNRFYFWQHEPPAYHREKKSIAHCYGQALKNPQVIFHMFTYTLMIGSLVAFYSASPLVFIEHYHLSPKNYGWLIVGANAFYILAVIVVRLLLIKLASKQLSLLGFYISLLGAVMMVVMSVGPFVSVFSLIIPIFIYLFGAAFIPPVTNTAAMEAIPRLSATVSSLMGASLALSSGVLSYLLISLALRSWLWFSIFFLSIPSVLLIYYYGLRKRIMV